MDDMVLVEAMYQYRLIECQSVSILDRTVALSLGVRETSGRYFMHQSMDRCWRYIYFCGTIAYAWCEPRGYGKCRWAPCAMHCRLTCRLTPTLSTGWAAIADGSTRAKPRPKSPCNFSSRYSQVSGFDYFVHNYEYDRTRSLTVARAPRQQPGYPTPHLRNEAIVKLVYKFDLTFTIMSMSMVRNQDLALPIPRLLGFGLRGAPCSNHVGRRLQTTTVPQRRSLQADQQQTMNLASLDSHLKERFVLT